MLLAMYPLQSWIYMRRCLEIKSELIAYGVRVVPPFSHANFKYVIKSLYGYEKNKSEFVYPQEIILGAFYATIRRNDHSPWSFYEKEGKYFLEKECEVVEVDVPAKPPFYDAKIEDRVVSHYVQKMGQDLLTTVIFNSCEYYSRKVQCAFCEISETYQENRLLPRPKKNIGEIAEAIRYALSSDPTLGGLLINGGNLSKSNDHTYLEIIKLLNAIQGIRKIDIGTIVMAPENFHLLEEIKEAGVTEIYLNLEFWREDHFRTFAPGKAGYGRKKFFEILEHAVDVFGRGSVFSNLVYGIQSIPLTPPYFYQPEEEEKILLEGLEVLADRGVIVTNTIYHSSGRNILGPIQIDAAACARYHLAYAERIRATGLLSKKSLERGVVYGHLGSFPNSLNNEAFCVTHCAHC